MVGVVKISNPNPSNNESISLKELTEKYGAKRYYFSPEGLQAIRESNKKMWERRRAAAHQASLIPVVTNDATSNVTNNPVTVNAPDAVGVK